MDYALIRKIIRDSVRIDHVRYACTEVVTIAHDNDRSLLYDGKYYSPLIDTIEDDLARLGIRCQSIARIISTIKGHIAYGNVVSPDGAFARALISKRVKSLFSRGKYPFSQMEEKIWGKILDVTGARKVIGIQPSRELCAAAHKRDIWVADVQHGIIGEGHLWYGERYRANDPKEQLPDAFCCWDYGSQEVIERWASKKGIRAIATGNRWVARFQRPLPDDWLAAKLIERYRAEAAYVSGKPTILVSLTWGDVSVDNGFMFDGLRDVIQKTSDRIRWLVRLHPNQLKGFATHEGKRFPDYYRKNLAGHVEWSVTTRSPLPVVLAHADLHISSFSSVGIEAAQMGVKSAMLDPRLRVQGNSEYDKFFRYYREKGMIYFVEETEDKILNWIEKNLNNKKMPEDFDRYDQEYAKLIDFLAN